MGELSKELREQLYPALQKVPAIGLPGGGMGHGIRPQTDEHLVAIIAHMAERLGETLRASEAQREQIRQHEQDIATIRRVFGTAVQR